MASPSINKGLEVADTDKLSLGAFASSDVRNAIGADPWWRFGGHDRIFVPSRLRTSDSSLHSLQEDTGFETGNNNNNNNNDGTVFSDSQAAEFYEPIEKYEGRHRFDTSATWSDEEEKKLVRRVIISGHSTIY